MRHVWTVLCLALLVAGAGPATAAVPTRLAELVRPVPVTAGPQRLVQETSSQVLDILRKRHDQIAADPSCLYGLINRAVLPHFDFRRMAAWVLGRYWRRTTPQQKVRFVEAFRQLLVRTYGMALLEFYDLDIRFLPTRVSADGRSAVVRTRVIRRDGPPVEVNYRMYRTPEGWKVYDVSVGGISLVSSYRAGFLREIRTHGIEALIHRIVQQNAASKPKPKG